MKKSLRLVMLSGVLATSLFAAVPVSYGAEHCSTVEGQPCSTYSGTYCYLFEESSYPHTYWYSCRCYNGTWACSLIDP